MKCTYCGYKLDSPASYHPLSHCRLVRAGNQAVVAKYPRKYVWYGEVISEKKFRQLV